MIKKIWSKGESRFYEKAIGLFNQGQYRLAIRLFKKMLVEFAGSRSVKYRLAMFYCAQSYYELGKILFAMGNYLGALQEFEEVLRIDPERTEIYECLGRCYEKIGARPAALKIYNRMADFNPYRCPAELKMISAFHRLGIYDRIEAACIQRLEQFPQHADLHFILGLTYLGMGKPIHAIPALEKAVIINPAYWSARIRLGAAYTLTDELNRAETEFSMILGKYPDYVDLYHHLGIIHAGRKQDPQTAMQWFQKALSGNPNFSDARIKLVIMLCATGRFQEAVAVLKEGLRLNPENSSLALLLAYFQRGTQYPHTKTLPNGAAEELIAQTITGFGKNLVAVPSISEMLMLTRPVEDMHLPGLLAELVHAFQEPGHLYARYPDFHWGMGSLHYRVGHLEEAEKAFRLALELNPGYTRARLMLFNTLKTAGKIQPALEAGNILLDQQIDYPDLLCGLGELYLKIKSRDKAEELFKRTLEHKPDFSRARIFLKQLLESERNSW